MELDLLLFRRRYDLSLKEVILLVSAAAVGRLIEKAIEKYAPQLDSKLREGIAIGAAAVIVTVGAILMRTPR